ncbi:type II toxin-antitoxin system VapC family toxin [Pyrodictium abyssi]|uniref:PIN domain-containing protein n=1 Tax=Pyrodictium abyssi TaxID=54256 RepID=A0ABM8IXZ1_9CREN|nr:hypothetical protein PABY_19740 [Pyrodictium abyssi]
MNPTHSTSRTTGLGSVVWKEARLLGDTGVEEALEKAEKLVAILSSMHVLSVRGTGDYQGVARLALETGLTFYDAAYAYMARKHGLTLVTQDRELREKASRAGVKTATVDALEPASMGGHGPHTR